MEHFQGRYPPRCSHSWCHVDRLNEKRYLPLFEQWIYPQPLMIHVANLQLNQFMTLLALYTTFKSSFPASSDHYHFRLICSYGQVSQLPGIRVQQNGFLSQWKPLPFSPLEDIIEKNKKTSFKLQTQCNLAVFQHLTLTNHFLQQYILIIKPIQIILKLCKLQVLEKPFINLLF